MAYVIAEPCVGVKDTACVSACPVDCIYVFDPKSGQLVIAGRDGAVMKYSEVDPDFPADQLPSQLFINPDECIDCDACKPVCPVSAIFPADELSEKWQDFERINCDVFKKVS